MKKHSIGITWKRPPSTLDLEHAGYAARDAYLALGKPAKEAALAAKNAMIKMAPIFCAGNLVVTFDGEPIDDWSAARRFSSWHTLSHSAALTAEAI